MGTGENPFPASGDRDENGEILPSWGGKHFADPRRFVPVAIPSYVFQPSISPFSGVNLFNKHRGVKPPEKKDILKIKRLYKKKLTKAPTRDWGKEQQQKLANRKGVENKQTQKLQLLQPNFDGGMKAWL
jgi:hypothetical protein